ncbi:MAG TPA: hypothetical protein VF405_02415 [Gammaproteobacteria bacterium]
MKPGILNSVLVEQVRNTAAWLWADPHCRALTAIFEAAVDEPLEAAGALERALRLRLAAHYATVATFVPTDVDAHIRHHMWISVADAETFERAKSCVDEAVTRDARVVSARVTEGLSGHDGEWLAVRAGALGRALVLGLDGAAAALAGEIDGELDRSRKVFAEALERGAPAQTTLALATTIAHNLGDLSRVVDAWPKAARASELCARYSRLGHADGPRAGAEFLLAGTLNKELMAHENHRFLALRKPRALRRSRALLLPVGPWFDAWGETVCRSDLLDEADRAEVVAALVELHLRSPLQDGCLRALAAIHRETRGGLGWYGAELPARLRKELGRGRIREVIDVPRERFEARIESRCRALVARLTGSRRERLRATA